MPPDRPASPWSTRLVLRGVASWLEATPAETLGLALLLTGGMLVAALVWWAGAPRSADHLPVLPTPEAVPSSATTITVHVTGAVSRPGLVALPPGARVADALEAAGGPRPDAAVDALNLARSVSDGEQIAIPTPGAPATASHEATATSGRRPDGRLDLNRAAAAELEQLPGLGPVLAGRIVGWRDEHGPFTSVGQLRDVPGIGPRKFESIVDLVVVVP